MDDDGLARAQLIDDLVCELRHCLTRARDTAIGDWERTKANPVVLGRRGFTREVEVRLLDGLQERHDEVDARLTPSSGLIVEPLRTARSWNNAESSSPRPGDPKDLRRHGDYSLTSRGTTSRGRASTLTPRSRNTT